MIDSEQNGVLKPDVENVAEAFKAKTNDKPEEDQEEPADSSQQAPEEESEEVIVDPAEAAKEYAVEEEKGSLFTLLFNQLRNIGDRYVIKNDFKFTAEVKDVKPEIKKEEELSDDEKPLIAPFQRRKIEVIDL